MYIQLPTDMVDQAVDASLLEIPIDTRPRASNSEAEELALQVVLEKIYKARRPVFLVDGAAQRRRVSFLFFFFFFFLSFSFFARHESESC